MPGPNADASVIRRAAGHAALGDPARLAVVDALVASDRTPTELGHLIGMPSNLLAHHLDMLATAGLIGRSRSSGDGRRRYVHLVHDALPGFAIGAGLAPQPALFVCTQNSARSQLAAALWTAMTGARASSAGTRPARHVHKLAVAAAKRADLFLRDVRPRHLDDITRKPALVITVCDQVHEELHPPAAWLHWSVPDPVEDGHAAAFDASIQDLRRRITSLIAPVAA